jgi:hypothetical protein
VRTSSQILVLANSAGTGSGNEGPGRVVFTADGEALTGSLVARGSTTITASLHNHTILTDTIRRAALRLDATSRWIVTSNSALTNLTDATISGSAITNVVGHGHVITYDESLAPNTRLGGNTYTLAGGGRLVPA